MYGLSRLYFFRQHKFVLARVTAVAPICTMVLFVDRQYEFVLATVTAVAPIVR